MASVALTQHLFAFFPALEGRDLEVDGDTVADIVRGLEEIAPGFEFYVCDEVGRLRHHVNIFVGGAPLLDRGTLSDPVEPGATVHIMQALSGG